MHYFEYKANNNQLIIKLFSDITIENGKAISSQLFKLDFEDKKVILDLNSISSYDSYIIVVIDKINSKSKSIEIINDNLDLEKYIRTLLIREHFVREPIARSSLRSYIENIGYSLLKIFKDLKEFVEFLGEVAISFVKFLFKPSKLRWKEIPHHFSKAGVNALGIVLLIMFLIGLILAYQSARQLSQFGADIYVADLIGISVTRELAPLMTAIIIAGRSGSSFAAEIGSMNLSSEVDALKISGFDVNNFLVLPRLLSVVISIPILTMLANFFGVLGGLVASVQILDITVAGYINQLQIALNLSDIFTGLIKSVFFGGLIAVIGCFRGFQVSGDSQSLGFYTTSSVVTGILFIIIFDAIFTFFFQALGW